MNYGSIVQGEFVDRPNRFVAHVNIGGIIETVHVKNTGRCKELLLPGSRVYLEKKDDPSRSTAYDLIAVEKEDRLINMDSQAPNKAVKEWLEKKVLFPDLIFVRPETTYGNSRFDFYVETETEKIFIEVKGVTREADNVVCFPDAPSERAIKHMQELIKAKAEGYRSMVLFVVQMSNVKYFTPDRERHEAFAETLCEAAQKGVEILAYDCEVKSDYMEIREPVPVVLDPQKKENENLLREMEKPLLSWYDEKKRSLPWREDPKPYKVWVSEIMLQQTRVEAVKPYFERFMRELPNIKSLAQVSEEKLLKLWEGLGYYNRARNLKMAAETIVAEYDGEMPGEYEKILALKGIGSYTAGAISSIAFGLPYPAVDGNVLRVLARIRKDERAISDVKVKALVEEELKDVMPVDRPGDFNQAMMELGACVCIPNGAPHCHECPLKEICKAHIEGVEELLPVKEKKTPRKIEEKTILIIRDENRVALHKRPKTGLLAGMYEFPMMNGKASSDEVIKYLEKNGLRTVRVVPLQAAKHIFSHIEWHMQGFLVRVDELDRNIVSNDLKEWIFVDPKETRERYPIPSAFEAYTGYLNMKIGSSIFKEQ